MDTRKAYDTWALQYDTNENKTRDLEGRALQAFLANILFDSVLEIGCGTGKNTEWLIKKAQEITSIDLSDEMLGKAKEKITSSKVRFKQADITFPWTFTDRQYDLVNFSLVLEHIHNLDHIFNEASGSLKPGGYIYIGELHPCKQYLGTKARFDIEGSQQIVECFDHHISEFIQIGKKYGLKVADLNEFFDNDEKTGVPRILTILFKKDILTPN